MEKVNNSWVVEELERINLGGRSTKLWVGIQKLTHIAWGWQAAKAEGLQNG
jgi:hypothetical protein